jgi:hypothetical protein
MMTMRKATKVDKVERRKKKSKERDLYSLGYALCVKFLKGFFIQSEI